MVECIIIRIAYTEYVNPSNAKESPRGLHPSQGQSTEKRLKLWQKSSETATLASTKAWRHWLEGWHWLEGYSKASYQIEDKGISRFAFKVRPSSPQHRPPPVYPWGVGEGPPPPPTHSKLS